MQSVDYAGISTDHVLQQDEDDTVFKQCFPMDLQSVRLFAVSESMSLIDLKNFGRSLGLAIKSTSRRAGFCDRLVFGLKTQAIRILQSRHDIVEARLFKFGVSSQSDMFNCSKSPVFWGLGFMC